MKGSPENTSSLWWKGFVEKNKFCASTLQITERFNLIL